MFSFPSLPEQWEKRLVRYLLHKIDLLEDRTLADLANIDGSIGRNSVFTLKDVGIKVERVRQLIRIPPRVRITEAVVSSVTVTLPANLFYSGAVEIVVDGVLLVAEVPPPPKDDASSGTPSPPGTPRPGSSPPPILSDRHEFPHTAMDLAESFLEEQSEEDKEQLRSLYVDNPALSASITSEASSASDDEEELGIGMGMGLPNVLAKFFHGVLDRAIVRIRGTRFHFNVTLPEERGGEQVFLELEVEDLDVEGVTRNVTATTAKEGTTRPRKEGKRRITLENIRGFITTDASMYGINVDSPAESALFETAKEEPDTKSSIVRDEPPEKPSLQSSQHTMRQPSPSPSPSPSPPSSPLRTAQSSRVLSPSPPPPPPPPPPIPQEHHPGPEQSIYSDSEDKFLDYEDSDEEVLAFAPPSMHTHMPRSGIHQSRFMRRSILSNPNQPDSSDDDDSEDDADGGATFAQSSQNRSPSQSVMSASYASLASYQTSVSPQQSPPIPPPESDPDLTPHAEIPEPTLPSETHNASDPESSDDEMDQEASQMLSQSTIFSKQEADSLYMSATSGLFRSRSNASLDRRVEEDAQAEEDEEIDAEEMDQRLDRLINGDVFGHSSKRSSYHQGAQSTSFRIPPAPRRLRRECINVDIVTIYFPSLADGVVAVPEQPKQPVQQPAERRHRRETSQQMPGSFSMYASRHQGAGGKISSPLSPPTAEPVQHREPPKIKIVDAGEVRPAEPDLSALKGYQGPADIEVIASNVHGTVDIQTEKVLGQVIEAVQIAFQEFQDQPEKKKQTSDGKNGKKKSVQIVAEEIDVRLVKRLCGIFIDTGDQEPGDPTVQLQVLLNDVKIHQHGLQDDGSKSRLSVKKFAMRDEEEGIITFLPPAPAPPSQTPPAAATTSANTAAKTSSGHHRKRTDPSAHGGGVFGPSPGVDDDISVTYTTVGNKTRINVKTLPIRIRGDLKRLEEKFMVFGRFSSMLASTTASTATITRPGKPPPWKQGEASIHHSDADLKVDATLGGLVFDVIGSTATVALITSPIKIRFESDRGIRIGIEEIEVTGPDPKSPVVKLMVKDTDIEFAAHPNQDDLSRLIELITPSKDSFDDDDILVDTLLRQREQGSVVRMNVGQVRADLLDTDIADVFKQLGEEIVQVVTASPIVAGDERPGLLTLINVNSFTSLVELPAPIGRIETELLGVGLAHVSAPTLFAVAVGTSRILRGGREELLGVGMHREMFNNTDRDRPMIMVRMVGDEPEPVVKIKLWNVRFEYSVETLMALMEKPPGTTGDEIAQDMVQSIVNLPMKKSTMSTKEQDSMVALGFDVVVTDSVLALNPLGLKSKALVVLTNAQIQAALPNGAPISAGMEIKKASMMIIDDVDRLQEPSRGKGLSRSRKEVLSEHIAGFASMGYVRVVDISTAKALLRVVDDCVDLEVRDDLLFIESCPDSTQTLIALFDGLKPPPTETEEIKYCTEVMPIDMLQSLSEDAFVPHATGGAAEELLMEGEDLPTDLDFVGSFYGTNRGQPPTASPQLSTHQRDLLSSMITDDLPHTPTLIRDGSGASSTSSGSNRSSTSREQVMMLSDEPLTFQENYFSGQHVRQKGKRALNADAVEAATHFPLRLKVRDANVIWNLHDGYDWPKTRDTITNAVMKIESRAAERRAKTVSFDVADDDNESVVDDFLFNSIYIGIPSNRDPKELTTGINRAFDDQISESSFAPSTLASDSTRPTSSRSRSTVTTYPHRRHASSSSKSSAQKKLKLGRSRNHKVQIEVKGVNVDFLMFPKDSGEVVCSVELKVRDLKIVDCVPTSTWKMFLAYSWEHGEREIGSEMAKIECLVVKTAPGLAATELVIKVNLLPLRLRVDQDTLDFLTRFFEFKDPSASLPAPDSSLGPARAPEQPFIQRIEIGSVPVKLDYKPKKVDYAGLRSGRTTEFMNFFILEGADMTMRHVTLHGVTGFEKMGRLLNDVWMPDIKSTQLGGVLAGVAPVRSLVNLGKGARDLVVVPIREYRKDGRVVRSLQKGVNGFVRTTAGELVRLGAKAAVGTQKILQTTETILGASPNPAGEYDPRFAALDDDGTLIEFPDDNASSEPPRTISLYASPPLTVAAGLRNAQQSLRRNFIAAKEAAVDGWAEAGEADGVGGKVLAVAGVAPKVVLRPMVGVAEATSRVLLGAGNMIDKDERRRGGEKWKNEH